MATNGGYWVTGRTMLAALGTGGRWRSGVLQVRSTLVIAAAVRRTFAVPGVVFGLCGSLVEGGG